MAVVAVCKFPPFLSLPFFAAVETEYNQRFNWEKIMLYVDTRHHVITGQNIQDDHGGQRLHFVELLLKFLCPTDLLFLSNCHQPKQNWTVEQQKQSQQNLVPDHHGHPVPSRII